MRRQTQQQQQTQKQSQLMLPRALQLGKAASKSVLVANAAFTFSLWSVVAIPDTFNETTAAWYEANKLPS